MVGLLLGLSVLVALLPTAQSTCADAIGDTVKNKIARHVKVDNRLSNKGEKMCGKKNAFKKNTDAGTLHGEIADSILSCYGSIKTQKSKRQLSTTSTINATATLQYTSATYCPFKNITLPTCNKSALYRSNDGSCNNLLNPFYGNNSTELMCSSNSSISNCLVV